MNKQNDKDWAHPASAKPSRPDFKARGMGEPLHPHGMGPIDQEVRAFSTVELIGVLAVVAVLSSLLVSAIVRRIDFAARTKEAGNLVAISNAVVLQILNSNSVPDETQGFARAASWVGTPSSKISKNARGWNRLCWVQSSSVPTLPYVQTPAGTPNPPTASMIIFSPMGGAYGPVTTNAQLSAASFQNIWDTPEGVVPSTWGAYTGKKDDLLIQRISFASLFHRLVIENRGSNVVYTIGPSLTNVVNPSASTNTFSQTILSYYLNGTDVGLCDLSSNLVKRVKLVRDESFVWDGKTWGDDLSDTDRNDGIGQDFATLAAQFMAAGTPGTAQQGAAPQGAVVAMFNYMLVYGLWANKCPHFPTYSASNIREVPEYVLMLDVAGNGLSSYLNEFTGNNGLLK